MDRGSRAGRRRLYPALALAAAGCLAVLAPASLAQASGLMAQTTGTGAIAGTVEHAGEPLEKIEVSVYKPGLGGEYVESVKTNVNGE